MLKKMLSMSFIVLVMNLAVVTAFAGTDAEKEAKFVEKLKTQLTKLGTGKDARVEVKLRDKTKLKGYVSEIKETSFVVIDEKTATPSEIPFPQTKQIKGNNLSAGVKIAIVVAGVIGVVLLIGLLARGS